MGENSDKEKRAPVQGFAGGIPWEMHLRAYEGYCKEFRPQSSLIDLEGSNCRGGFGISELDRWIPGWREELSQIGQMKTALNACIAAHKTGRYEPINAAIENAENLLADLFPTTPKQEKEQ